MRKHRYIVQAHFRNTEDIVTRIVSDKPDRILMSQRADLNVTHALSTYTDGSKIKQGVSCGIFSNI